MIITLPNLGMASPSASNKYSWAPWPANLLALLESFVAAKLVTCSAGDVPSSRKEVWRVASEYMRSGGHEVPLTRIQEMMKHFLNAPEEQVRMPKQGGGRHQLMV